MSPARRATAAVKARPAENTSALGGTGLAILAGLQGHGVYAGLAVLVAACPHIVSWWLDHGGVAGVWRAFKNGRRA